MSGIAEDATTAHMGPIARMLIGLPERPPRMRASLVTLDHVGQMDEAEFDRFWAALGIAVRTEASARARSEPRSA